MGALADVRANLVAVLDGNVDDLAGNPVPVITDLDTWQPPAVIVSPSDSYVEPGIALHHRLFRCDILCVTAAATPSTVVLELENMAEMVMGALLAEGNPWMFERLSGMEGQTFGSDTYPTMTVTVSRQAPID